ncbi:MAG: SPOR domain-containing protein [Asticcacaulis sp.]|uniref:SPOR domain-containing protein n=1 Tax=Asticcacaulis sp. TaxID=1872648 RepID=UPI003F7B49AF
MSNDDRGTYSPPTEDNLSYETRRPASRDQAPVTLIISGICLVVLLVIVVVLYNSGLNKHGKIAPEVGDSVGGFKDTQVQDAKPLADSDLSLDDGQNVTFAPSAEAPAVRTPDKDVAPPPAAPIAGPLPSQAGVSSSSLSAPAAATPPSTVAPVVKPVTPPPASASVAAKAAPAAVSGGTAVQIGAFDSTDTANAEYAKVASSYGLFVGGAGKKIEKVTTANGTFYRTAFTGLTPDKARAFCAALKANGRDCIVR